jgi:putative transposase
MVGDLAHVCNRGVEKRKIFLDGYDYGRFVNNLYLLNNQSGKLRTERKNIFQNPSILPKQDKLVEILKWSLLPNHYHLLLSEVSEGGILEFTKRLGNAYTKYFNTKYDGRSGYLFQNSAKILPIESDGHFFYIPFYIDLNILDVEYPGKEKNLPKNEMKAFHFLKSYKWASFKDYHNEGEFGPVINKELFYDIFDMTMEKYESELRSFIREPFGADPSTWQVDG